MSTPARYIVVAAAVALGMTSGCRDPKEHEAVYRTDVTLVEASEQLPPTGLNLVYDDRLMQGRVRDPDLSHLQPTAPAAGEGSSVPAEITQLIQQFAGLIQSGQYDQVPDLFVEDLRDVVRAQFQQLELIKEIAKRTGDRNTAMMFEMGLKQAANIKVMSAKPQGEGILMVEVAMGPTTQSQEFRLIDGQWLFGSGGSFAGSTQDALKLSRQFNETLQGILDGLEDGSVDEPAAAQQFQAALAELMQAAAAARAASPPDVAAQDQEPPAEDEQPGDQPPGAEAQEDQPPTEEQDAEGDQDPPPTEDDIQEDDEPPAEDDAEGDDQTGDDDAEEDQEPDEQDGDS